MLFSFLKQWVIGGLSLRGNSAVEMKISIEAMPTKCPSRFVKLDTKRNIDPWHNTVQGEIQDVKIAVKNIASLSLFTRILTFSGISISFNS